MDSKTDSITSLRIMVDSPRSLLPMLSVHAVHFTFQSSFQAQNNTRQDGDGADGGRRGFSGGSGILRERTAHGQERGKRCRSRTATVRCPLDHVADRFHALIAIVEIKGLFSSPLSGFKGAATPPHALDKDRESGAAFVQRRRAYPPSSFPARRRRRSGR